MGPVDLPSGVHVQTDREITKAIAVAEKALEGTGKLGNEDNTGVLIHDLVNSCVYVTKLYAMTSLVSSEE